MALDQAERAEDFFLFCQQGDFFEGFSLGLGAAIHEIFNDMGRRDLALPWRGAVAADGRRRHYRWVSRSAIHWWQLVLAACALASFVGTPHAAAQMSVAGADHVMIVGTKVAPPFAMKSDDGSWSGISIELWRRIAADLHLSYRFEEVSLDELINGTAAHRLDAGIAAITVTATRAESVDFTQPYYATSLGITVRRASIFNWLNLTKSLFSLSLLKMLLLLQELPTARPTRTSAAPTK